MEAERVVIEKRGRKSFYKLVPDFSPNFSKSSSKRSTPTTPNPTRHASRPHVPLIPGTSSGMPQNLKVTTANCNLTTAMPLTERAYHTTEGLQHRSHLKEAPCRNNSSFQSIPKMLRMPTPRDPNQSIAPDPSGALVPFFAMHSGA